MLGQRAGAGYAAPELAVPMRHQIDLNMAFGCHCTSTNSSRIPPRSSFSQRVDELSRHIIIFCSIPFY